MIVTRRLLIPVMAFFGAVLFVVVSISLVSSAQSSKRQESDELARLEEVFRARLDSQASMALALASEAANNPEIQAAFAAHDRARLLELTLPAYQVLSEQAGVSQYHYHLPPATSFLRLHQPEKYGDDLSDHRQTILQANRDQKPVGGLEIGRGGVGVRGVVPVRYQGQPVGTVEFGMDPGQAMLNELKAEYGTDWQLMLRRDLAERIITLVEAPDTSVAPPGNDLLFQFSTLAQPFFADVSTYRRVLNGETVTARVTKNGVSYVVRTTPVRDFSGTVIGVLDIIANRTASSAALMQVMLVGLGLLLGFILAGWLGLGTIISRTLGPIRTVTDAATAVAGGDLSRSVEARAAGRTDEIGALARAFNTMTGQLRELIATLEQRVADRTVDLERQSHNLQASSEVARAVSTILDPDALGREVVRLIRERFELYYVGLFLVDETMTWAVLRAAAGQAEDAARAMLARGHRIRIGQGMIGWSIAHAEARVAREAGTDVFRLAIPELPETRSEAALPLHSRGRVLGALSVQSTQPDAFDRATLAILQTMADQVASAMDNARLYATSQEALQTARRAYGETSRQAWAELLRGRGEWGYRYAAHDLAPAAGEWQPTMVQAEQTGQRVEPEPEAADDTLAIPIRVRDEVIAVLGCRKGASGAGWMPEETAVLESLADQLGAALESARLYRDTQRRAAQEQILGQVTGRIRETLDIETMLKTAVHEVRQALGAPEVVVRLVPGAQAQPGGDGHKLGA